MAHRTDPPIVRQTGIVVISAEEPERLLLLEPRLPFVAFMESLGFERLDLRRDGDMGRDVDI